MISFLIPFKSEDEHRLKALAFIYNHLWENFPHDEVVITSNGADFNRATSRNLSAASAKGDVFVFVDADSYVSARQIRLTTMAILIEERQWAFPYDQYNSLTEEASARFLDGEREDLECEYVFPSQPNPEPAVGGMIAVSRRAFETVGGYDERFIGWGEEDRAFEMALHTLVEPLARLQGPLFHLWHPHPVEECFEQPNFTNNRVLCNRYREAYGIPQMMQQLVDEHR